MNLLTKTRPHRAAAPGSVVPGQDRKGKCAVRFDFAYDGDGKSGTLSVNGKKLAEGGIVKTVPVLYSTHDTFDVGEDWGTPVSPTYKLPFKFTGTLKNVTVETKPSNLSPQDKKRGRERSIV